MIAMWYSRCFINSSVRGSSNTDSPTSTSRLIWRSSWPYICLFSVASGMSPEIIASVMAVATHQRRATLSRPACFCICLSTPSSVCRPLLPWLPRYHSSKPAWKRVRAVRAMVWISFSDACTGSANTEEGSGALKLGKNTAHTPSTATPRTSRKLLMTGSNTAGLSVLPGCRRDR